MNAYEKEIYMIAMEAGWKWRDQELGSLEDMKNAVKSSPFMTGEKENERD